MTNSIQESINNAIDTIVNRRVDALALDKTVIGIIDSYIDTTRGLYKIKYDGGYFNARSQSIDAIYLKGMAVYVQIPQNDTTKEKLIISRASDFRNKIKADVTVSAINNFSIIGTNLLKNTAKTIPTKGIGIRSYHDPATENLENNTTITHRAQSLFGTSYYYKLIDTSFFDTYRKNATALMIEADFRTALSEEQKQQSDGVYGIGLDLKFNNVNYSIGETQGQIFDYYADKIKSKVTVINGNKYNGTDSTDGTYITLEKSVLEYAQEWYNILKTGKDKNNNSVTNAKLNDYIDMYISYITATAQAFENSEDIKTIEGSWKEVVETYLTFLNDLKLEVSRTNMKNAYDAWRANKIASAKYNNIAFVLDSNSMTGNPYNYTDWSTQYAIFSVDMDALAGINNILFYKDGFKLDEDNCEHDNSNEANSPREDIFVKNIKIYALKPISAENGDYRLEIQSPNGLIFDSLNTGTSLEVIAKVSKAYYQDLTENSGFLWFKKSRNVTTVSSTDYNKWGGVGWKYLPAKGNRQRINLTDSENQAYENVYKCVAILNETIILAQEFYVYNFAAGAELKIKSDLGINFSFDSGIPTLTCMIKTNNGDEEITSNYHYYWAIVVNGQRTFLSGAQTISPSSTSIKEITNVLAYNNLINGLQFFKGATELTKNFETATRIRYPITNIGLENAATFECYVERKDSQNKYQDIGCATLTLTNKTNVTINDFYIEIENGNQIFQYDEYGDPPNAQKLKTPQEIKPLICHLFNPTGLEIPSGNYTLNWVLPLSDTMLKLDISGLVTNPANNKKEIDNTHTQLKFDIIDSYNENYQNNQITCWVTYNGQKVTKDTNLLFTKVGENGTNGTDTVARILPVANNSILDQQPLTLYRYNINNNIAANLFLNCNKSSASGSINLATTNLKAHLYLKNGEIPATTTNSSGTTINNYTVTWNAAGATKTLTNDKGKKIKTGSSGTTLIWDESLNTGLSNYILKAKMTYDSKEYYAFYPLCIIEYTGSLPSINRISIDKKSLLKEILYNADGRNPIYSHSQGVKINNLPKGKRIRWRAYGGASDNDAAMFSLLTTPDGKRPDNGGTRNILTAPDVNMIYILPNDEYNGASCNNRVEATVLDLDADGKWTVVIAKIIVPIYMHLNTFGLASLNAWDGNTVTIDEDGGYIMAPQIGAGDKDKNNRFTGVLMGKTETNTGKGNKSSVTNTYNKIGLFGYSHGLESIFLDAETGNATFGLPDGYIFTSDDNNVLVPFKSEDEQANYSEGRIELRPGNVSTIGGWRIGRRSLFYATAGTAKTIDGKNYAKGTVLPTLDGGNETNHEKDIGHQDSGILLAANNIYKKNNKNTVGNNPYISLKGRSLVVWDGKGSQPANMDIDNRTGNSPLKNGDSLELQLDPQQSSIFTIYKHYVGSNGKWTRTPIVGINAEGRFYSNALQDEETSLNLSSVPAFGKQVSDDDGFTGVYIGGTGKTIFKAFINKGDETSSSPLRITGGLYTKEYDRSISLHGKEIYLYAKNNNNDTIGLTTKTYLKLTNTLFSTHIDDNTYIEVNKTQFFAGTDNEAYIKLARENTKASNGTYKANDSCIVAFNHLVLRTNKSLNKNGISNNNIYIETSTDGTQTNRQSYLELALNGATTALGWTDLNGTAHNGNVNLYAQSSGTTKSILNLNRSSTSYLSGTTNVALYTNGKTYMTTQQNNQTVINNNSYLVLYATGGIVEKANTTIDSYAYNGMVTIRAQSSGTTQSYLRLEKELRPTTTGNYYHSELSARDGLYIHSGATSYLYANNGNIDIRARALENNSTVDKGRLFLSNNVSTNPTSFITAINNFKITANGDNINTTLGTNKHYTKLNLDTGNNWNGGTQPNPSATIPPSIFAVENDIIGGFQFKTNVKPGYVKQSSNTYYNSLIVGGTYAEESAALTSTNFNTGTKTAIGLAFNWGYFPGRMFTSDAETGNVNYVNTSIYADYRIISNTGFKTTKNSSSITMLNHTINSGSITSHGHNSSYSITGDNLYTLLQQLLGKAADALNYAKAAYVRADEAYDRGTWAYDNRNDGLGSAAWANTGDFASAWHSHNVTVNYTRTNVSGTNVVESLYPGASGGSATYESSYPI